MKRAPAWFLVLGLCAGPVCAGENEVLQGGPVKVFVREHPQTGKAFVSLRKADSSKDPFKGFVKREIRPNYKMLDAKTKSGEIPYDGPVSDMKKVYVFAATMMTLGVAGGIVTVAIPAGAAGIGGGTGLFGAEAATVVAATAGTVAVQTHIQPGEENYIHDASSTAVYGSPQKLSLKDVLREIDAEEKIRASKI